MLRLRCAHRQHAERSDAVAASDVNVELSEWGQQNGPKELHEMDNFGWAGARNVSKLPFRPPRLAPPLPLLLKKLKTEGR